MYRRNPIIDAQQRANKYTVQHTMLLCSFTSEMNQLYVIFVQA